MWETVFEQILLAQELTDCLLSACVLDAVDAVLQTARMAAAANSMNSSRYFTRQHRIVAVVCGALSPPSCAYSGRANRRPRDGKASTDDERSPSVLEPRKEIN